MKYNVEQCIEFIRALDAGKMIVWKTPTNSGVDTTLEHLINSLKDGSVEIYIASEPVVTEHWEVWPNNQTNHYVCTSLEQAQSLVVGDRKIVHVVTTRTEVL